MGDSYLFGNVTASNWLTIIFVIWGAAIVWAVVTCLITRITRNRRADKNTEVPGLCSAGCAILGIVGGVCALNLVGNALGVDIGFAIVLVLFIAAGIIGGSAYGVGRLIVSH